MHCFNSPPTRSHLLLPTANSPRHPPPLSLGRPADRRYQGLKGVVVRDTANTLQLVTPEDRFVVVPKQLCTWELDADRRRVVTLLGPGLLQRGAGGGAGGGGGRHKTLRDAIRGQQRG